MRKYNKQLNYVINKRKEMEDVVRHVVDRYPGSMTSIIDKVRIRIVGRFDCAPIHESIECIEDAKSALTRLTYEGDIICEKVDKRNYIYRLSYSLI